MYRKNAEARPLNGENAKPFHYLKIWRIKSATVNKAAELVKINSVPFFITN